MCIQKAMRTHLIEGRATGVPDLLAQQRGNPVVVGTVVSGVVVVVESLVASLEEEVEEVVSSVVVLVVVGVVGVSVDSDSSSVVVSVKSSDKLSFNLTSATVLSTHSAPNSSLGFATDALHFLPEGSAVVDVL
jgi:hypothetical protein